MRIIYRNDIESILLKLNLVAANFNHFKCDESKIEISTLVF